MAAVVITNLSKAFPCGIGRTISAVNQVNLTIADGEWLALVGPSGSGKTTLLRMIAGLEIPDSGRIAVAGRDLRGVPPQERDVAVVFQQYALYPHMTARENLHFGLRLRRVPPAEAEARVIEVAGRLGLADCLERRPAELSGGQCQRVALGRALVRRPRVLLLDEPFSNLDAPLRAHLRALLKDLHQELHLTVLHITHDQSEALSAGQRVAVMNAGALHQVGSPAEVYHNPATMFVAQFVGAPPMNQLRGRLQPGATGLCFSVQPLVAQADLGDLLLELTPTQRERLATGQGRDLVLGFRAEDLEFGKRVGGNVTAWSFAASVSGVESFGCQPRIWLETGGVQVVALSTAAALPVPGQKLTVSLSLENAVFFDQATGQRLA